MMKNRKLLLVVILLLSFSAGFFSGILYNHKNIQWESRDNTDMAPSKIRQSQKQLPERKHEKVLIGYIQDFRDPNIVDYAKLTHIIFSFAHPTKDGEILLNDDWALKNLRSHVANAKQHNTKVILAVGGWYHVNGGESYDYFKAAI